MAEASKTTSSPASTAFIREQGWLLERDVLKTEMILKRY